MIPLLLEFCFSSWVLSWVVHCIIVSCTASAFHLYHDSSPLSFLLSCTSATLSLHIRHRRVASNHAGFMSAVGTNVHTHPGLQHAVSASQLVSISTNTRMTTHKSEDRKREVSERDPSRRCASFSPQIRREEGTSVCVHLRVQYKPTKRRGHE